MLMRFESRGISALTAFAAEIEKGGRLGVGKSQGSNMLGASRNCSQGLKYPKGEVRATITPHTFSQRWLVPSDRGPRPCAARRERVPAARLGPCRRGRRRQNRLVPAQRTRCTLSSQKAAALGMVCVPQPEFGTVESRVDGQLALVPVIRHQGSGQRPCRSSWRRKRRSCPSQSERAHGRGTRPPFAQAGAPARRPPL